jgi:hypothetical protein
MKKHLKLWAPVILAGAALVAFAGGLPGEKPAADPEMQTEISALRSKVQALEGRVKDLESTVAQMKQPHLMPLITPGSNSFLLNPPVLDSRPPKIWGEREVNGWKVYIVPCDQQSH